MPAKRTGLIPIIERELITYALRICPAKDEAARFLGIAVRTLYNRIHEYGIPLKRSGDGSCKSCKQ